MNLGSLFSGVASTAHTFLGYLGKALGIVAKIEPEIADGLSGSMKYIEPLVVDIVTVEYGAAGGALADAALKELLLDSAALKSLIFDWKNSPGIVAKFRALAADVASIVALGHIKNADSIAKAQRIAREATAAADAAEAVPAAA